MAMFDCFHCGDRHHVNDFCATGPMACHTISPCGFVSENDAPQSPGGWLIKNDEGGWDWTGKRIAAVAAKTEGRKVYDVTKGVLS